MLDQAFVHGRFQPPHRQHLEYISAAKQRCRFLWIGITRFDIQNTGITSPVAPHRDLLLSNPLTFFERVEAITTALTQDLNISKSEFGFIPLPIDEPEKIKNFMSEHIPCFTTICDEWNLHKIEILEKLGFQVEVLIDRTNQPKSELITGSLIREKALAGNNSWRNYISPGVLTVLDRLEFIKRIKGLQK